VLLPLLKEGKVLEEGTAERIVLLVEVYQAETVGEIIDSALTPNLLISI